jgi:hypothetical protein
MIAEGIADVRVSGLVGCSHRVVILLRHVVRRQYVIP